MQPVSIAIIGAGNMGGAILGGLIANHHPKEHLWITDPQPAKLNTLKERYGIHATHDNAEAISHSKVVILAVKPQMLQEVTKSITAALGDAEPLILSIAAGVRLATLKKWLGEDIHIVRCMPNSPALIQAGVTALCADSAVTPEERLLAESIMAATGMTLWVDRERDMDAVTALSGSGPAYFFYIMHAMEDAAIALGLPEDTARKLTVQTALGAARMAAECHLSLTELEQQVTSKGGTTEAALKVFDDSHVQRIIETALLAAQKRSVELAKSHSANGQP